MSSVRHSLRKSPDSSSFSRSMSDLSCRASHVAFALRTCSGSGFGLGLELGLGSELGVRVRVSVRVRGSVRVRVRVRVKGRAHARGRAGAEELDERHLVGAQPVHREVEQPQVRVLLREHDELGEVAVPGEGEG